MLATVDRNLSSERVKKCGERSTWPYISLTQIKDDLKSQVRSAKNKQKRLKILTRQAEVEYEFQVYLS